MITILFALRLEEESNTNHKLLLEKTASENKMKSLEEQITIQDDNMSKVRDTTKYY